MVQGIGNQYKAFTQINAINSSRPAFRGEPAEKPEISEQAEPQNKNKTGKLIGGILGVAAAIGAIVYFVKKGKANEEITKAADDAVSTGKKIVKGSESKDTVFFKDKSSDKKVAIQKEIASINEQMAKIKERFMIWPKDRKELAKLENKLADLNKELAAK
jgi:hypothetical protein